MKTGPFKMSDFSGFGDLVEKAKKMSGSLTSGQASKVRDAMRSGSMSTPSSRIKQNKIKPVEYKNKKTKKAEAATAKTSRKFKVTPGLPVLGEVLADITNDKKQKK